MVMRPILTLALATAAISVTAQASTLSTRGSAVIAEPAGIEVLSNVVLPAVVNTVSNSLGGSATSSVTRSSPSNAALTVRAQSGDTLSMAVPESFEVVRSGGTEGLTVKTTSDSNLHVSQGGVVLGGSDVADGTMSVNVGGLVSLASAGAIVPGPYEGTLVVLVQYN